VILETVALTALAASSISDAERRRRKKRVQSLVLMGQWRRLRLELGTEALRELVKHFPLGSDMRSGLFEELRRPLIRADIADDIGIYEQVFDAEAWFEQASDEEILELADTGFGGDYPADNVAYFMEDRHRGVARTLEYARIEGRDGAVGFEVHVDPGHAMAWIRFHRKHLLEHIE
jgi:hypothetical protein